MSGKYGSIGSISYQEEALRRLKNKGSIVESERVKLLSLAIVGRITRLLGLNMGFVTGNQIGLVNISRKTHGDQWGVFGDLSKKVTGSQLGYIGIQHAGVVGKNQVMWKGVQVADVVGGNQVLGQGAQIAGEVQAQVGGIAFQKANDAKIQMALAGIQDAHETQYQVNGVGVQNLKDSGKLQMQLVGTQLAEKVDEQGLGVGLQSAGDVGSQLVVGGGQLAQHAGEQTNPIGFQHANRVDKRQLSGVGIQNSQATGDQQQIFGIQNTDTLTGTQVQAIGGIRGKPKDPNGKKKWKIGLPDPDGLQKTF